MADISEVLELLKDAQVHASEGRMDDVQWLLLVDWPEAHPRGQLLDGTGADTLGRSASEITTSRNARFTALISLTDNTPQLSTQKSRYELSPSSISNFNES